MLRDTIAYSMWFGCYDTLKSITYNPDKPHSVLTLMVFGGMSGEWYWLSTYPIDVWKTRIQSDSFGKLCLITGLAIFVEFTNFSFR